MNIPDHPAIRNAERTGYGGSEKPEYPICPVCGEICETVYYSEFEIVGCDNCISGRNAWEDDNCFPERN